MPRSIPLIVFLLLTTTAGAQTLSVRIIAAGSETGIANVQVSGLQSGAVFITDSSGFVRIPGGDPGPFRIYHLSYQTRILRPDTAAGSWVIRLSPNAHALDGVEVLSPLARYRRDSAFNHTFFRRELADARFKPGKRLVFIRSFRGVELGIEWSGIFSNLALLASGKKGQYRKFARELRRTEASKYAAIRYTTSMVSEQTGLDEDSAMAFIEAHPLDEDFLRNASELELKMRVREMHRLPAGH